MGFPSSDAFRGSPVPTQQRPASFVAGQVLQNLAPACLSSLTSQWLQWVPGSSPKHVPGFTPMLELSLLSSPCWTYLNPSRPGLNASSPRKASLPWGRGNPWYSQSCLSLTPVGPAVMPFWSGSTRVRGQAVLCVAFVSPVVSSPMLEALGTCWLGGDTPGPFAGLAPSWWELVGAVGSR